MRKYKLGFLLSHPVQYNSPLFAELAEHPQIELEVLYCSPEGLEQTFDPGFSRTIAWDIPLLAGYRSQFLKNHSFRPGISRGFFGLLNFGIIKKLAARPYDALVVHSWHYGTHLLAIICSLIFSVPLIVRSEWPYAQDVKKPMWKRFLKRVFLRTLLRRARFLAIGKENQELYLRYGVPQDRIFHCPYAVDNRRFFIEQEDLAAVRGDLRKDFGIADSDVAILFVGKLVEKKRPLDLLKAFERLSLEQPQAHLLFVGDGALRGELELYVKERCIQRVRFVGFKNQTELAPYYSLADIFVLPSGFSETWGLVVNEAMCFYLPIVVSDVVGCAADLARTDENGFVFPCADVEALGDCLTKLILEPGIRARFGAASRRIVEDYSYGRDLEGIVACLSAIT